MPGVDTPVSTTDVIEQQTAHVLFTDIVGYSRLADAEQARVFRLLQEMVAGCPSVIAATRDNRVVRTPTGDGMALSFFGDASTPLRCAEELAEKIAEESPFEIRMGINSGPVVRQIDINRNTNVSGDGINTAQRVMDFGDAGHILLSEEFAHALEQRRAEAHELGTATAKHGKRVRLFNFYNGALGNAAVPMKVRKDPAWTRPKGLRLGLTSGNFFVGALQILGWIIARPRRWREHVEQIDPELNPSFSIVELSRAQLRNNPDLRRLVLQSYGLCVLLILVVSTFICGAARQSNIWYSAGAISGFAVMPLVLGAAPGLAFLLFQALLQPITSIHAANTAVAFLQIMAISAAAGWLVAAVPRLAAEQSARRIIRELLGALAGIALALLAAGIVAVPLWAYFYSGKSGIAERVFDIVTFSAMAFIVVNGAFGIRWGRWSRGFASGQAVGVLIAIGYGFVAGSSEKQVASRAADLAWRAREAFPAGLGVSMMDAITLAFAFAVAEKIAGTRAGVLAPMAMFTLTLIVDSAVNTPSMLRPFPLIAVAAAYVLSRRKR